MPFPSPGAPSVAVLPLVQQRFDELTAKSALRSLLVAGLVVAAPAFVRPEAAAYYMTQGGLLMLSAGVLLLLRRRLGPQTIARAVLAVGAAVVTVAAVVSGGTLAPAYHAFGVAIVAGAWLVLTPRGAFIATGLVVVGGGVLAVVTSRGWLPAPWIIHNAWSTWGTTTTASGLVAMVQWLEVHRLRRSNTMLHEELQRSESAQQQAAESEQRYADMVSTAPGVVYAFEMRPDGAQRFTFISEGARALFDLAPSAILDSHDALFRLIDGDGERARLDASIQQSFSTLTPWDFEATVRTPAGHARWVRAHAVPSRGTDGTVRWNGFITDMTARVEAERAVRQSQDALKQSLSMLQGALESTADGLFVVDTEGRVTGCNQKFLSLWRVPEAVARTRDAAQIRAHLVEQVLDREAFRHRVAAIYADPRGVSFDTLELADGRRYERFSQPQVVDGVVVGRVWSFRDVTARADEARRRTELEHDLQRAHTLEALGTLSGGIAHDFNNLLTIIWGNAEQAMLATQEADRTASLQAVVQASQRASALVREIREFSQPRATERAVVAVADAIGSALHLLRSTMPKHIELTATLDPSVTMFANATQVQQVVTNLVLNAAQAVGDTAGRIRLVLDDVPAADVPPATPHPRAARYARLTVSDTGRGIAADAIPRIFEPFFTTKATGGSGLGLAVVNGIVRRYHGTIAVDSAPGTGTTFRVYWPALPPETSTPVKNGGDAATGRDINGRGRHILVVDDEAAIARMVADGLRRMGYRVTAVTDPREALAAFTADPHDFDAVLSDLSMPHLSGAALGRRMLDLRPDTPIVLFTGYSAELSPDEARAAGFRAVLNKPMTLAVLAESLHRVLPAPAPA